MRALVTGGAGFIGSHIVEELLKEKAEVIVLDDLSTGSVANLPKKGIEFIKGSICDRELLAKTIDGVDCVFHEAAQTSVVHSIAHPAQTWETNIRGTKLLLNAAVKAKVKRFVFASSAAVYGNALPPLVESKDYKPISPYGDSKRMGELLMTEYHAKEKLSTVSLRYFNVFGPRQNPKSEYSGVISKFIDKMSVDERPTIYGNGMQTRDFIYVKDIVQANMLAMKMKKAKGEVFNIGTGSKNSILDIVNSINQILGKDIAPIFESERAGDIRDSVADISLAKEKLGFEPKVSLKEGLKETIDWQMKAKE